MLMRYFTCVFLSPECVVLFLFFEVQSNDFPSLFFSFFFVLLFLETPWQIQPHPHMSPACCLAATRLCISFSSSVRTAPKIRGGTRNNTYEFLSSFEPCGP